MRSRAPRIRGLVELSNVRLFKDTPVVDAPFPTPEPDQGQWIVLVGENGTGKTTLLRAIGLALADPNVATRLLDENQTGRSSWSCDGGRRGTFSMRSRGSAGRFART